MNRPRTQKRRVKGWGVYTPNATHGICWSPNRDRGRMPLAIFADKYDARRACGQFNEAGFFKEYRVIPVTITYQPPSLPSSKEKKK